MRKSVILSLCCISLIGKCLHGQSANLIFEAKFESTLQSEEGENALLDSGLSYAAGILGMGLLVEDGDILQYAVQNNINPAAGSLSLWVRPNWDPGEILHRIMVVGKDQRNFELHMDENRFLAFSVNTFQLEDKPIVVAFADASDWKKDSWYFLTFTWSADKIAIYVNGRKAGETEVGFDIPADTDDAFLVGSVEGQQAFDGTMDELRIYDAPLPPAEVQSRYEEYLESFPLGNALSVFDIFGRDVSTGLNLVDWEGPVRNPALKYYLKGNEDLQYPVTIRLSSKEERAFFNLPSTISKNGPAKTIEMASAESLESFLFSVYMDEDDENNTFDLELAYNNAGIPSRQIIQVNVIDQDVERPLTYPVIVDFSEARDPFLLDERTQAVIRQAATDWLYYVDGEGIDPIQQGESYLDIGGPDHLFDFKRVSNPVAYKGYYLYAFGNPNGEGPCVCSSGAPNRDLLQSKSGEVVPVPRIGALHLNLHGQAFETPPTGWEVLGPFDNWAQQDMVGTDLYTIAKHEIGHAMVFEEIPLYKEAQERLGFVSPALTEYYQDTIVPLLPWSTAHLFELIDPASQSTPYGGGVENEVMPLGREMLTKLDILIMESVGYPLRENEVTRPLSLTADHSFTGALDADFEVDLVARGGIPIYHYEISEGVLPAGLELDSNTGKIFGRSRETGMFPVTFRVKDYDERSVGALLEATINMAETTTGIEEVATGSNLIIYPNPSRGQFAITMDNAYKGSLEFILYDLTGKQVRKISRNKTDSVWQETIDFGNLNTGVYFLGLLYQNYFETFRVIMH